MGNILPEGMPCAKGWLLHSLCLSIEQTQDILGDAKAWDVLQRLRDVGADAHRPSSAGRAV